MTTRVLLVLLLLPHSVPASSPFDLPLVNGLQFIYRIFQNNGESPISFLFDSMKAMLGQEKTATKGDTETNEEEVDTPPGIWRKVFQSLGFESKQVPDIAFNILMFLIKMISNSYGTSDKPTYSRNFPDNDTSLLHLVLKQPQVSRLMSQMQDPGLMVNVLQEAESQLQDSPSDCTVQLLCRSTPVVRGMQTSLSFFLRQEEHFTRNSRASKGETADDAGEKNELEQLDFKWGKLTPLERFFLFMPSLEDFMITSALCRRKYPNCD